MDKFIIVGDEMKDIIVKDYFKEIFGFEYDFLFVVGLMFIVWMVIFVLVFIFVFKSFNF